MTSIMSSETQ